LTEPLGVLNTDHLLPLNWGGKGIDAPQFRIIHDVLPSPYGYFLHRRKKQKNPFGVSLRVHIKRRKYYRWNGMVSQPTAVLVSSSPSRDSSCPHANPSQRPQWWDPSLSLLIRNRGTRLPSNRQTQSEKLKGLLDGLLGHLFGLHSLQIGNHEKGCQKILGLGYFSLPWGSFEIWDTIPSP